MIGGLFLQSTTLFSGGAAGSFLNNLQQAGLFSYVIPFLLIFALVFGILSRMGLFKENKAITSIIALAVGLMALQLNTVPRFFTQIFPRLGVVISIILVILIVLGLFMDPSKPWIMYILFGIAAVMVVVILVQSEGALGATISGGSWLQQNWQEVVGVIVVVGVVIAGVIAVVSSGTSRERKVQDYNPYFVGVPGGK